MRQRLLEVLHSCQAFSQYTAGLDFADYERNRMVRDAVERRLGIIGEALSRTALLTSEHTLGLWAYLKRDDCLRTSVSTSQAPRAR